MLFGIVLPLPRFLVHPVTAAVVAAVHVYLAAGHLWSLFGGEVQWTHIWKGFGALGGAYMFAALGSRGLAHDSNAAKSAVRNGNSTTRTSRRNSEMRRLDE